MRGSLLWLNDRDIMNLWMLQLRYVDILVKKVSTDIDNIISFYTHPLPICIF